MEHPQRLLLPFLAAVAGVGCLALMDALMKGASLAAGVYTASLLRSLLAGACIAPFWLLAKDFAWPRGKAMKLHIERGVISAFMALSWFYALTKLPIAEAIAISFVAPLIALYFAHLLLGEKISRAAIGASVLGFVGTLVIIGGRIGQAEATPDLALGLASLFFSALLYAYNFVVMRKQAQVAGPLEVATFHGGIGGAIQAVAAPWLFVMPGSEPLIAIGISAALTGIGAVVLAWAYARAEAQVLVPVEYTGFLWAALFGWLFFAEEVTVTTLMGVALIVVASWIAAPKRRKRPEIAKAA